jgi:hypothetical protein
MGPTPDVGTLARSRRLLEFRGRVLGVFHRDRHPVLGLEIVADFL